MATAKTITVFGGSGFLGQCIAKSATSKGWHVTSISRSGRPPSMREEWHDTVTWVKGDVFEPETYASHIARSDHVVTTVGILDYRGVLKGGTTPFKVIDRIGSTLYDSVRELVAPPSSPTTPSSPFSAASTSASSSASAAATSGSSSQASSQRQSTELDVYDKFNYDAAVSLSNEVMRHANVKSMVYVSAAAGFPGIPTRYITTKRKAESYIEALHGRHFRAVFMRPGFMWQSSSPAGSGGDDGSGAGQGGEGAGGAAGKSKGFTKPVARLLGLTYAANSALSDRLLPFIGAAGVKPLAVERVGAAIVEACDDDRVDGPVEVFQIEALADTRWRAEMIV